jgi:hypothetical protein
VSHPEEVADITYRRDNVDGIGQQGATHGALPGFK